MILISVRKSLLTTSNVLLYLIIYLQKKTFEHLYQKDINNQHIYNVIVEYSFV